MTSFKPLFLIPIAAAILFSCKKPGTVTRPPKPAPVTTEISSGMGDKPESISGFFYASNSSNASSSSPNVSAFCIFIDPANDLMAGFNHYSESQIFNEAFGNISVGNVRFNNNTLIENNNGFSNITYRFNTSFISNFNSTATWHTDGNGSFKPLDLTIPRGFPQLSQIGLGTSNTYTVKNGSNITMDFTSRVSNYDSLVVIIGYYNSPQSVAKTVKAPSTQVEFTWSEISFVSSFSNIPVIVMAFNYSNKTISNRKYVFELATKRTSNLYVIN